MGRLKRAPFANPHLSRNTSRCIRQMGLPYRASTAVLALFYRGAISRNGRARDPRSVGGRQIRSTFSSVGHRDCVSARCQPQTAGAPASSRRAVPKRQPRSREKKKRKEIVPSRSTYPKPVRSVVFVRVVSVGVLRLSCACVCVFECAKRATV